MMTPEQLSAIQARCDRAQWTLRPSSEMSTCEAIADIPALLDEVRRLQGQVEALVGLVERMCKSLDCLDMWRTAANYQESLNAILNGAESEGGNGN